MKKKTILSLILCAAMMITCTCGNSKDKERFTPEVNETTGGEVIKNTQPEESTELVLDEEMSEKVKNYIFNEQSGSEATKIKWSSTFLNAVDIDSLYKQFVANGGEVEDVSGVAAYITANAPIADNWQEMFEKEINSTYGEKISKVEYFEGDLYTAYVIKDGKEVPYVTVNARTGYFHG